MKIDFYKPKDHSIILTITRTDGTSTWSKLYKGIEDHDLAHFAVEEKLKMTNAFFGLVNKGADISDFADKEKQPSISIEARQVEFLVNLLQTEYWNNAAPLDICKELRSVLNINGIPMIGNLTNGLVEEIRIDYHRYIKLLHGLKAGEHLDLVFKL